VVLMGCRSAPGLFGFTTPSIFPNSSDWVCSPMLGWSSRMLPTRVQILVLTPFPGFIPGFSGVIR
jgi:hypothetical protein